MSSFVPGVESESVDAVPSNVTLAPDGPVHSTVSDGVIWAWGAAHGPGLNCWLTSPDAPDSFRTVNSGIGTIEFPRNVFIIAPPTTTFWQESIVSTRAASSLMRALPLTSVRHNC